MNCPKCGYSQEERMDCKKCGVVFAKYFALHSPEDTAAQLLEAPGVQNPAPEDAQLPGIPEMYDLRQSLRELQGRFNELEFERAERRQIRSEMRSLSDSLQNALEQLDSRLARSEEVISELPSQPQGPTLQEFAELKSEIAENAASTRASLSRFEERLEELFEKAAGSVPSEAQESLAGLEARMEQMEEVTAGLARLADAGVPAIPSPYSDSTDNDLEELRSSLQAVTLRYSEIGELKKNHLVIQSQLETLQQGLEARDAAGDCAERIEALDQEVSALKAELRQIYERLDAVESSRAGLPQNSDPLKEEIAALERLHREETEGTRTRIRTLESRIDESLGSLAELPGKVDALSSELQKVDEEYNPLIQDLQRLGGAVNGTPGRIEELGSSIGALQANSEELRSELEQLREKIQEFTASSDPSVPADSELVARDGEMKTICEGIDEIRRFMDTLSRKI